MEVENEIMHLHGEVARLSAEVDNLCGWQKNQNGSLVRIDEKVQGIYRIMLGTATTAVFSLLGTIITLMVLLISMKN